MADVGEIVVRIRADAAQLQRELANASQSTRQAGREMSESLGMVKEAVAELLPAFAAGTLIEFTKSAIEGAAHINDLADRIGFANTTLSALNIPLKQSGSNLDEFSSSINRMNNLVGEAAKGLNKDAIQAFDDLGLSVKKLQALSPEDQFYAISQALAGIDNQARFTNAGVNIFGRSFAAISPMIKESRGNLQEFTEDAKKAGDAITAEQLAQVKQFGDEWTEMIEKQKVAILGIMPALQLYLDGINGILNLPANAFQAGVDLVNAYRRGGLPRGATYNRPGSVGQATVVSGYTFDANGNLVRPNPASGSNPGLSDNKYQVNQVKDYIANLQAEVDALSKSDLALDVYQAQKEAAGKAVQDFNNHLRDTPELTEDERTAIALSVDALYVQKQALEDVRKEQEKQIQVVAQMESQISDSLSQAVLDYKNFGSTVASVLEQIAKQIIQLEITQPLVGSITGALKGSSLFSGLFGGSGGADEQISPALAAADPSLSSPSSGGFFDFLHFAGGGSPPVGVPSIVGEEGPELFVPNTAGTIVPNGKLGGTTVIVQQTIQVNPGVPELINAKIRESAPSIAGLAHASVFQAIQQGGPEARIVGRRN